jgi:predicted RNase H-like HicB family nuclease
MKLTIVIDLDGDGFDVKVPALPGCGIWARTEGEAKKQITEVIELYLYTDNAARHEKENRGTRYSSGRFRGGRTRFTKERRDHILDYQ